MSRLFMIFLLKTCSVFNKTNGCPIPFDKEQPFFSGLIAIVLIKYYVYPKLECSLNCDANNNHYNPLSDNLRQKKHSASCMKGFPPPYLNLDNNCLNMSNHL